MDDKVKMIQGVAFDMDGLIFDSEKVYKKACYSIQNEFNIELREEFYLSLVGTSVSLGRQLFLNEFGDDFPIDAFQARWDEARIEMLEHKPIEFQDGFEELFQYLISINMPIALVTASFYRDVEHNFRFSDYLKDFKHVISSDDNYLPKPSPEKYLAASSRLGIDPQYMLVLEDSNSGIRAAIDSGAQAYMIPDLLPANEYAQKYAKGIYSSLSEFHQTIFN